MIFLRIQAPGMGFPLGKGEGDGAEAALIEVVGIWHGFSLTASFRIPLPSFTTSNIRCFCVKPQQGTAVIAGLFVPCMPAPSAFHPVTLRLGREFSPSAAQGCAGARGRFGRGYCPVGHLAELFLQLLLLLSQAKWGFPLQKQILLWAGRQPQDRTGLAVVGRGGCHQHSLAATTPALPMGFPHQAEKRAVSSASPTAANVELLCPD